MVCSDCLGDFYIFGVQFIVDEGVFLLYHGGYVNRRKEKNAGDA